MKKTQPKKIDFKELQKKAKKGIKTIKKEAKNIKKEFQKVTDEISNFDPMKDIEMPDFNNQLQGFNLNTRCEI